MLDSLVVHLEATDDLLLFVVLRDGVELDDDAEHADRPTRCATRLSPRHVPGRHRRRARDPAHDDRQEARAAREADPHRLRRRRRRSAATRSSTRTRSSRSPPTRDAREAAPLVPGLDHALVLTDDLEATLSFYRDTLGFTVAAQRPQFPVLRVLARVRRRRLPPHRRPGRVRGERRRDRPCDGGRPGRPSRVSLRGRLRR